MYKNFKIAFDLKKRTFIKRTLKMYTKSNFFLVKIKKSSYLSNFLKQKLNYILPWTADDWGFEDGMALGHSLLEALLKGEKWSQNTTLPFFRIQQAWRKVGV